MRLGIPDHGEAKPKSTGLVEFWFLCIGAVTCGANISQLAAPVLCPAALGGSVVTSSSCAILRIHSNVRRPPLDLQSNR